ncbi:glycosyltransferase family 1 protein [Methylophilus methylotrophus]|uniref:glycosyltransferase family 1 protein n=1 Tax=Methylophilus methylotrophus TaxID=17 RepID=UPI000F59DF72|nr:glycosyltransferase family 1 protein [Methylophilus methylotrophus]
MYKFLSQFKLLALLVFKLRAYFYQSVNVDETADKLKLTYLCPNAKKASGGTKVIYRHTSLINGFQLADVSAQIFHPKNVLFRCQWFFPNLHFKNNFTFDGKNEVYVINEMWAGREAKLAHRKGIKYMIQVQGGYDIFRKSDWKAVYFAYQHAQLITCVSQDIYDCLVFVFPEFANKIHRIHLSLESDLFKPAAVKSNLITYMPRKLKKHSDLVLNFIKNHLPSHWTLVPIDGMNLEEVAQLLAKSKIFLSFSELEGFGLPPIEAALAGNLVIGYIGEAGREYWLEHQFHEIPCGNIKGYAQAILDKINAFDDGAIRHTQFADNISLLAERYNSEREINDLKVLIERLRAEIR